MNQKMSFLLPVVAGIAFSQGIAQTSTAIPARTAKKETLGQFRAKYLGQRIYIRNPESLIAMDTVRLVGDKYVGSEPLPPSYASQESTVVAIQLNETLAERTPTTGTNALGERVTDDDYENPPVEVIFRFDDGQLAKCGGFVSVLEGEYGEIELVSARNGHAAYLEKALPEVIGRNVYAIADSRVFPISSTLQDLTFSLRSLQALQDVPYLQPLRIVDARYNGATDRVVLKLQLPDGRFALAATPCDEDRGPDTLSRIAGKFLTGVPAGLTAQEVKAIQEHKIFRGMTRRAVEFSWGSSTTYNENDWGKGGKQLVYVLNNQVVYLDSQGVVTDWQSMDHTTPNP
jgi:hypothetical protein